MKEASLASWLCWCKQAWLGTCLAITVHQTLLLMACTPQPVLGQMGLSSRCSWQFVSSQDSV